MSKGINDSFFGANRASLGSDLLFQNMTGVSMRPTHQWAAINCKWWLDNHTGKNKNYKRVSLVV